VDTLFKILKIKIEESSVLCGQVRRQFQRIRKSFFARPLNLAYTGKHISILLWNRLFFKFTCRSFNVGKGQSKIKLLPAKAGRFEIV